MGGGRHACSLSVWPCLAYLGSIYPPDDRLWAGGKVANYNNTNGFAVEDEDNEIIYWDLAIGGMVALRLAS